VEKEENDENEWMSEMPTVIPLTEVRQARTRMCVLV